MSRQDPPAKPDEIIFIIAGGVAGVAVGLLMGAIGSLLNSMQAQMQMMHRLVRSQEDAAACLSRMNVATKEPSLAMPAAPAEAASAPQAAWPDSQRFEQILEILTDMSENLLLTPEQRQAKRSQALKDMQRNLAGSIGRLLASGNFVEAQARVDQHGRLFPEDHATVERLQQQIDEAHGQVEENEYEQAAAKVRDLMATAAWQRADEVAQVLLKRHPKSQRVRDLADGVRQEQARFQQQHCQHVLSQIEQCGAQRQWREAYRLGVELVNQFGSCTEAQIIRDKLDTLRENAEIEVRKDLELQYKELYQSHRYIEALALAQDVISRYPNSPQAKALREQLPQLMSKAKLQMDQAGRTA